MYIVNHQQFILNILEVFEIINNTLKSAQRKLAGDPRDPPTI